MGKKSFVQLNLTISNIISKFPLISKNIGWAHFLFYLHFNSFYLKLLVSQVNFLGPENLLEILEV